MTCFKEHIMDIFLCQELYLPSFLKSYTGTLETFIETDLVTTSDGLVP